MHGSWVGFARGVISAPDPCDELAQAMVMQKLLDSMVGVIADHGTDHTGAMQLVEQLL